MDVPFTHFAHLVETLSSIPPTPAGRRPATDKAGLYLQKWIQSVQKHDDAAAGLAPGTALAFFRLLFPEDDRRRYGMQEATLAQTLVDVLAVPASGRGAALFHWGDWSRTELRAGCLGLELRAVLQQSFSRKTDSPTLRQVDGMLSELAALSPFSQIAQAPSTGQRRSRKVILRDLYKYANGVDIVPVADDGRSKLSPFEAAVVTQVILRDLRPILYPGTSQLHTTLALKDYNSRAYHVITKWEAMKWWDTNLPRAYRARGSWEEACDAWDNGWLAAACIPRIGVPVEIPKSVKATSCEHVAKLFFQSSVIYAETKYDGERMQIHVDMGLPRDEQIRIFSKSKRDSTGDRDATLSLIRDALRGTGTRTAILEAEMVAYSDDLGAIDEFWRIRSLVEATARGVRRRIVPKQLREQDNQSQAFTQSSMISNASAGGSRHLAVVFFDVLLLNDTCMLDVAYEERRRQLERVIQCSPGYVMLAERIRIDMKGRSADKVEAAFARRCAEFEEGLVLKAGEGGYNEPWSPWVKLKKDYISGLGDTMDLAVVGAAWDKDRGRELGVGPGTFTTFWIACPCSKDADKPEFKVLFTASYGLDRAALEELNFVINAQDNVHWDKAKPEKTLSRLPYLCDFGPAVARPSVLLCTPLLADVMGAGFTKSRGAMFYELRFPRILRVHRRSDRPWTEGVDMDEYQAIARLCVGREKKHKSVSDEVKAMWGVEASPKVRSDLKRKEREDALLDRLQPGKKRKLRQAKRAQCPPPMRAEEDAHASDDLLNNIQATPAPVTPRPHPRQPLRESNNVETTEPPLVKPPTPSPLTPPMTRTRQDATLLAVRAQGHTLPTNDFTHVKDYLRTSFVCILQPRGSAIAKSCFDGRPRSQHLVPEGRLFHSIQALLVAIGWQGGSGGVRYSERGIIFADAQDRELLGQLIAALSGLWQPGMKECRVVDAAVLHWETLPNFCAEVEGRILWHSSTLAS